MVNCVDMKYGLLTYTEQGRRFNIGDYVQSLAARQFLPRVDALINREEMAVYDGDPIKIILNGWFTHNVVNWVPSEKIHPLFISFHVNSSAAPYILSRRALEYLKRFEPIGCRDQYTVQLLEQKGIGAYFSGCLTLTLDTYTVSQTEISDECIIVDLLYNYPRVSSLLEDWKALARGFISGDVLDIGKRSRFIKKMLTPALLAKARFETQLLPAGRYTDEQKFAAADGLLKFYARARLVITSRIHCALPCLAIGTPVIFINGFDSIIDICRFQGIINLFNTVDVDRRGNYKANFELPGRIDLNTKVRNPTGGKVVAEHLREKCKAFIAQTD